MTRPRLRPAGPTAVNPERKAIEQRAREATKPASVEKKGRWPFTAETSGAPGESDAANNMPEKRGDEQR